MFSELMMEEVTSEPSCIPIRQSWENGGMSRRLAKLYERSPIGFAFEDVDEKFLCKFASKDDKSQYDN